ncbi:MAG: sugar phosphate isomerase/epimerase [Chloroflexi bacterium]|nr:sugar phosphate isomerase/epimerase [Chloroflexota bacterium]
MTNTSCSTALFRDRELPAALDAIAAVGFPQVELNVREPHVHGSDAAEERRLLELFAGHAVHARTMHAPSGRSILAALDDEWRRESVAVLSGYLRLAGSLGLTEMVIHPIPNPDYVPDTDDPALPQRLRDGIQGSLDALLPVIEEAGVRVTLENLPYPDMPLNNMEELREVVAPYPSDAVGLIIDLGHAGKVRRDPADEIRAAGERLCGTHIHDLDSPNGDVDHHSPALNSYDWAAIRQAFAAIGYAGPWTMEVSKTSRGESLEELAGEISAWLAGWL